MKNFVKTMVISTGVLVAGSVACNLLGFSIPEASVASAMAIVALGIYKKFEEKETVQTVEEN